MKGVSEVIAIILILMIVIALAALAYTWFSGVFAGLTGTAGTAVTQTTSAMSSNFKIENAKYGGLNNITVIVRNLGTENLNVYRIAAYIKGYVTTNTSSWSPSDTISSYSIASVNFTNTSLIGSVCDSTITLTNEFGISDSRTIKC